MNVGHNMSEIYKQSSLAGGHIGFFGGHIGFYNVATHLKFDFVPFKNQKIMTLYICGPNLVILERSAQFYI